MNVSEGAWATFGRPIVPEQEADGDVPDYQRRLAQLDSAPRWFLRRERTATLAPDMGSQARDWPN